MAELAAQVQEITGENVELAYADQGYTGEAPATAAQARGIELVVIKHHEPKRGFVLLPRRWVVERSPTPGAPVFAGSRGITNDCPPPWQGFTS